MLIEWNLFVQVSLNSDRFTVPREPLCPGLPYRDHDFHTKTLNNKTDTSKFSLQCAIRSKKNHENNESWKFKNASSYLYHMKHHMTNNDCPVTCPVSQCTSTYTVYKSLTSHISRFHKGFDVINAKAGLKLSKSQDQIDNDIDADNDNMEVDTDEHENEDQNYYDLYLRNMALMLLKIQEQYHLPANTVQLIISDFTEIINLTKNPTIKVIEQTLVLHSVKNEVIEAISQDLGMGLFNKTQEELSTVWRRDQL